MTLDIATRVYNHTFHIDPVVRTLLDNDFYKLLMQQMIRALHPTTRVTFSVINRSSKVRLAEMVDERELREQLDHARTVRLERNELIWLAGNTFYGVKQIFTPDYLAWLAEFRLPDYELRVVDGQFELRFEGPWAETTAWEIPALSILNELRARAVMRPMSRLELDILYAQAKAKAWAKAQRLNALREEGPYKIADFGTRRRHSFLWQRWCVEAMRDALGPDFIGTSNVKMAMDLGLEAIGTNAHELPMAYAAMANSEEALRRAPYAVLEDWGQLYGGNLLVVLPDTYGTSQFLAKAPDWVAKWKGARPDSKPPVEATEELIAWWRSRGEDPREKLVVLSDGMDVDSIEDAVRRFTGRVRLSFGWGTNLTNDFRGCIPSGDDRRLDAISLVCKVTEVNGRPAVKLSDNRAKASGPWEEIERYRRVFGEAGVVAIPVRV